MTISTESLLSSLRTDYKVLEAENVQLHADYMALEQDFRYYKYMAIEDKQTISRLTAELTAEVARLSNWESMGDIIEDSLLRYRMKNFVDDDGESLPLVDHLSIPGTTIDTGSKEISLITDWIIGDLMDIASTALRGKA